MRQVAWNLKKTQEGIRFSIEYLPRHSDPAIFVRDSCIRAIGGDWVKLFVAVYAAAFSSLALLDEDRERPIVR